MRDGLALDPDSARLHCLSGMVAQEQGDTVGARAGFDAAATVTLALDLTGRDGQWRDGDDIHGERFRY